MIEVRWHGRGGQGGWTAARLLGKAVALFEDKFALAFPSFGPERRGAPVLGFTKIDDKKILDRSEVEECDYVVILDETLINDSITHGIKETGVIVINTKDTEKYKTIFGGRRIINVDATGIALDILKKPITNTAMLAALVSGTNIVSLKAVEEAVKSELKPALVEKNLQVLKTAFEMVQEVTV